MSLSKDRTVGYCINYMVRRCKISATPLPTEQNVESNYDLVPNLDEIISRLTQLNAAGGGMLLAEFEIIAICSKAREVLLKECSLLEVTAPIDILGDIHGQYSNLLNYFKMSDYPPKSKYLFLGDYVDRGKQSVETLTLLLALKVRYSEHIYLLRGNHESSGVNRIYGFFDECKRRYSIKLWRNFVDCYNCMPVAALIENNIFCCYGGLSPSLFSMDQIREIERPCEIPDQGLLCDLLWSDPGIRQRGWRLNERGVSYTFGSDVASMFLKRHALSLICRGHQVVEDGYEFFANRQLITIFSAPNYCGEFDNAGAMLSVDEKLVCSFHIQKPVAIKRTQYFTIKTLNLDACQYT